MKVIIAVDKFKGSLTSAQAAQAVKRGVLSAQSDATVVAMPVADGGDGTVEAVLAAMGDKARRVTCSAQPPLPHMAAINATYALTHHGTAVIELAAASGLALVPTSKRNAMQASTMGTGQMIAHAIASGCRHVIVGLGGSASTDGGTGLLSALGFKWLDSHGNELAACGANLSRISAVDDSAVSPEVRSTRFTVWTDVTNPLCGPDGAACVFGPQKAASPAEVAILDDGLRHLSTLMPTDVSSKAGAGAAGGTAAGMMAWLGADVASGAEAVLDVAEFGEALHGASLVITGEGRIDGQTAMGKIPTVVARQAHAAGVPVIALTGCLATDATTGFDAVLPILPRPMTETEAMRSDVAATEVERTAQQAIRLLKIGYNHST